MEMFFSSSRAMSSEKRRSQVALFSMILAVLLLIPVPSIAANQGIITRIDFLGANDPSSPNVVQLQIQGGYSLGSCDTTFGAIRKTDNHLVAAALAAHMANKSIIVSLNELDKYYGNRCVITMVIPQ